jgi:hypothetical protein
VLPGERRCDARQPVIDGRDLSRRASIWEVPMAATGTPQAKHWMNSNF